MERTEEVSFLKSHSLVVSRALGLPVCLKCKYAVTTDGLALHLRKKHKVAAAGEVAKVASGVVRTLGDHALRSRYFKPSASDILPMVPELPVTSAFFCKICGRCYTTAKSFRTHCTQQHDKTIVVEEQEMVPAQCVFHPKKSGYFRVQSVTQSDDDFQTTGLSQVAVQKNLLRLLGGSSKGGCYTSPEDPREISGFLSRLPLHKCLEDLGVTLESAHSHAMHFDYNCARDRYLRQQVVIYTRSGRNTVSQASTAVRRSICLPEDNGKVIEFNGHLIKDCTLVRYANRASHFLFFLLRLRVGQSAAISRTWDYMPSVLQSACMKLSLCLDDPERREEDIQNAIHNVFYVGLVVPSAITSSRTPVSLFFAFSSVRAENRKFRFARGKDFSPLAAGLLAIVSFTAAQHILRETSEAAQEQCCIKVQNFFALTRNSPAIYLRNVLKIAAAVRSHEYCAPRFMLCSSHIGCARIDQY